MRTCTRPIRIGRATRVAFATVALAATARAEGASSSDVDTRVSSEIATYGDTDHVFVFTPTVSASLAKPTAGWSVGGSYLLDVVSAASVDIVSTASRRWTETRHAGSLTGDYKPGDLGVSGGASISSEPDYLSLAGGASVSKDFAEKNFTLLAGYGYGHDTIGVHGTPFSVFSHVLQRHTLNAGLTAVVDKSTVLGVATDVILERGDSSKPYRYVPMFAADVAGRVPAGASIDLVNALRSPERPLEQLPTSRDRFALTGRLAHRFDRATIRVEERLYDDSWALLASTTDARYIVDASRRWSLWPHMRYHVQSPASFWQRAYVVGPGFDIPALRTGDRELGPLWNLTSGGGARWAIGPQGDVDAWALGAQLDVTWTSFQDDLYVRWRTAVLGAMTIEARL